MSVGNGLSVLIIVSENQLWVLLIFASLFHFFSFTYALIFIISSFY